MARAGRFGTKGLAVTFVADESDAAILNEVQKRFEVQITEMPDEIDVTTYSRCLHSSPFHSLNIVFLLFFSSRKSLIINNIHGSKYIRVNSVSLFFSCLGCCHDLSFFSLLSLSFS